MLHPHTELRYVDGTVGHGVFATAPIPMGTLTWVKDPLDRVFTPKQIVGLGAAFEPLVSHCTFADERGNRILCWDLGRYMNHSCRPTCGGTDLGFELALRDIAPGEQLTNDYVTLHIEANEGFECRCGEPTCRGTIEPHEAVSQTLLDAIRTALLTSNGIEQPLSSLLSPTVLRAAKRKLGLETTKAKPVRGGGHRQAGAKA